MACPARGTSGGPKRTGPERAIWRCRCGDAATTAAGDGHLQLLLLPSDPADSTAARSGLSARTGTGAASGATAAQELESCGGGEGTRLEVAEYHDGVS